jgi:hypothetical protein
MNIFSKNVYGWTRDLHLYLGLFLSPFVLLFAISTLFLNHSWHPQDGDSKTVLTTSSHIAIPDGLASAQGMEQAKLARQILNEFGFSGEIDRIVQSPGKNDFTITVAKPGQRLAINVNLEGQQVTVEQRNTGIWDSLIYLHRSPGPHAPGVRGNWFYTRLWRSMADTVVYTLLFLSVSGVYLWAVIKTERRIGLVLLGAGAVSFFGIVWAMAA